MEKRLFFAIPLDDSVLNELKDVSLSLRKTLPPGTRVVPREELHITILFLGDRDISLVPQLRTAMETLRGTQGFPVRFEGVSYGPPGRPPRMVWLLTSKESEGRLRSLHDALLSALKAAGIDVRSNGHPFAGHVTLARLKEPPAHSAQVAMEFRKSYVARALILMESELMPAGPIYREVASVVL